MIIKGKNYIKSRPDIIAHVDENYPHAIVDVQGNWYADANPLFAPPRNHVNNEFAFVFNADRKFYSGLIVALISLLEFHPKAPIVIIERGFTDMQKKFLNQFAEVIPSSQFIADHVAWDRFEVSFLPFKRIIFLDSDIVILKPLDLFIQSDAHFAAVKNLDWKVQENFKTNETLSKYNISSDKPAFFAGGFTMDNTIWGKGRLFNEAVELYHQHWDDFVYGDQSALQIIMYKHGGEITFIEDGYNALAECWDWENKRKEAKVIHYTGEFKPWHLESQQPEESYFFKYSKIVNR